MKLERMGRDGMAWPCTMDVDVWMEHQDELKSMGVHAGILEWFLRMIKKATYDTDYATD